MSHFASADIDAVSGRVASLKKTAISQRTTSGNGAVEGNDLLTYTTPNDGVTRRYRLSAYLRVGTASDAATSDALKVQCSLNDGAAATDFDMPGTAAVDAKSANVKGSWMAVVNAAPNTALAIYVDHVVTGAKANGTYAVIDFLIERLD